MLSDKALKISPSPTLAVDAKAREMKSRGIDVIGFGAGEPDFDTPARIRAAAIKAIEEGHTRYTAAGGTLELREAVCDKLRIDNGLSYSPDQIVVSNGAKHSLDNILRALLNPGDGVLIPVPYWVSYPELVRLNGGKPLPVASKAENKLKITPADLEKAYTADCKILILNYPSNPTGQVYTEKELGAIAAFCCDHDLFIIADEIYEKLVYGSCRHLSIASFSEEMKARTVVVNGASKTYAMTGWRIGYTASKGELAAAMTAIQSHTTANPNAVAQKAALEALRGSQQCVEEMRLAFDKRRKFMYERIKAMPLLSAPEPEGAFYIFIDISGTVGKTCRGHAIAGSEDFTALLLETRQVAVVPGTGFGAPDYIRLSFATAMDSIEEGLKRIEAFVGELK